MHGKSEDKEKHDKYYAVLLLFSARIFDISFFALTGIRLAAPAYDKVCYQQQLSHYKQHGKHPDPPRCDPCGDSYFRSFSFHREAIVAAEFLGFDALPAPVREHVQRNVASGHFRRKIAHIM